MKGRPLFPQWRDENYGSVSCFASFRLYQSTSGWPRAEYKRFEQAAKRAGFTFEHRRCSWIAEGRKDNRDTRDADACREYRQKLLDEITAAGFTTTITAD